MAVCSEQDAQAIETYKKACSMPLVADIQFDYRLAIQSMEHGIDKVRFNPGNIGSDAKVRELVACAKDRKVPLRIGVNAGSLPKHLEEKYGHATADALVEAALEHVALLERMGFEDIVLSLKASTVPVCVRAYELMARKAEYPLHLGITEAGHGEDGLIKSCVGIGALLLRGLGDTLRVSLTGDPVQEVSAGRRILEAAGLRTPMVDIVSCPTCARCCYDLESVVNKVKKRMGTVRPDRGRSSWRSWAASSTAPERRRTPMWASLAENLAEFFFERIESPSACPWMKSWTLWKKRWTSCARRDRLLCERRCAWREGLTPCHRCIMLYYERVPRSVPISG